LHQSVPKVVDQILRKELTLAWRKLLY
jgi:hypothetical protein